MKSSSQKYHYSEANYDLKEALNEQDIKRVAGGIKWINFYGFDSSKLIESTFDEYGIHRLTRADIIQLEERPKVEEYDDYIYVTLKSVQLNAQSELILDQISFILTKDTVISYQEHPGDIFGYVRKRIQENTGLVRKKGADYLLYLLVEGTLLSYENALKMIDKEIVALRKLLKGIPTNKMFTEIENTKDKLRLLKGPFHPFKDQITKLTQSQHSILSQKTVPFFNDILDNVLYNSDEMEDAKNELESLTALYFARLSQRSNEVMQFLTIVAAIFIPLTFIAGIYGMNFQNMPELKSKNGYFIVIGIMLLIALSLILYFRRKKWF